MSKAEDRSLRLCVNYRDLNKIIIRNKYSLSLMNKLQDRVTDVTRFTKLDLMIAYNNILIQKSDEYKTAFRTRYDYFEWNVMSLDLCNASTIFQEYINNLLRDFLDQKVIVYFDDILIYLTNKNEHTALMSKILKILRNKDLTADIDKYIFDTESVLFLDFILFSKDVSLADDIIQSILDWKFL
jgi:hypothetical protein